MFAHLSQESIQHKMMILWLPQTTSELSWSKRSTKPAVPLSAGSRKASTWAGAEARPLTCGEGGTAVASTDSRSKRDPSTRPECDYGRLHELPAC